MRNHQTISVRVHLLQLQMERVMVLDLQKQLRLELAMIGSELLDVLETMVKFGFLS
jgi:hypothetical protein